MRRTVLILLPLLLFSMLPICSLAASNEAPLTLLNPPKNSAQTAKNQTISSEPGQLHDIHGPVLLTERPPYLLIAGALFFVLLLAAAIFWFLKKRTKPTPPPIPPWEKALLELADAKRLLNPERGLQYMDRVSQILRRYIESRFTIQSTRQTTREFLQGLAGIGGNSPLQTYKTELRGCLEQADMAKFAHHIPEIKNLEMMEDAVTTFIKKTEPTEPQKPKKQSKKFKQPQRGRS
ncbi:MAG: DUF4381 domain-containing protein [Desulfobulbaceae bacterium]|nr:DUF4381 domain-containing protein [Desulfobulbaceae bacterium]